MSLKSLTAGLAIALVTVLPARAQEPATPRIAYFIEGHIIQNSVRGKKLFAELEVLNNTLGSKLKAKAEEQARIEQQLKSPGITDEGRAKLQREYQDGDTNMKRLNEDCQLEFRKAQEKVYGQFNQEIGPLVQELAKEWKLQIVYNFQPGMMAYAEESWLLQFSAELAKRYDAKFEAGAAGAAKPATPAAKPAAPAAKPAAGGKKK